MNTPNKITMARILLIPVFFAVFMTNNPYSDILGAVVFALASLTDGIDGHIARKTGQVTDLGKFLDPLADKLLVATALICFVQLGRIPAWMAIIIIAREFMVMGLRSVAAAKGVIIAAVMTGKVKTCIQIAASLLTFFFYTDKFALFGRSVCYVAMLISTLFTIYSGYEYLYNNRKLLMEDK